MGDRYEHQTPGPMRWWKDISNLVNMNMGRVWAQVVDVLDRENRLLGQVSLAGPLTISVDWSWSASDGTTVTGTMTGTIT